MIESLMRGIYRMLNLITMIKLIIVIFMISKIIFWIRNNLIDKFDIKINEYFLIKIHLLEFDCK
jgi:hypothetical protein